MMSDWVEAVNAVGGWFVGFGWAMLVQSALLIGVVWGLDRLLRRRVRAVVRYGVWVLVLVKLVLPPGLGLPTGVGYWVGGAWLTGAYVADAGGDVREAGIVGERGMAGQERGQDARDTNHGQDGRDTKRGQDAYATNRGQGGGEAGSAIAYRGRARSASSGSGERLTGVVGATGVAGKIAGETGMAEEERGQDARDTNHGQDAHATGIIDGTPMPRDARDTVLRWQGVVFLGWLAVAVVLSLLLGQRVWFVRGLVRQAENGGQALEAALGRAAARLGVRTRVRVKVSANAVSPSVCGLWRPVVLLPVGMAERLGVEQLQAVLLHELAHVQRGDLWVNTVQTLLQIVYFYNPLVWLANGAIRRVREQAVDEAVLVALGEQAEAYPYTLLDVSRLAGARPALSLRLIGVVEGKSALKGRIKHMVSRPMPRSARLGVVGVVGLLVLGAVLLPMAGGKESLSKDESKMKIQEDAGSFMEDWKVLSRQWHGTYPRPNQLGEPYNVFLLIDLVSGEIALERDGVRGTPCALPKGYEWSLYHVTPAGETELKRLVRLKLRGHRYQTNICQELIWAEGALRNGTGGMSLGMSPDGNMGVRRSIGESRNVRFGARNVPDPVDESLLVSDEEYAAALATSRFSATLSNGVRVELLGVKDARDLGNRWWRPDGQWLAESIHEKGLGAYGNPGGAFEIEETVEREIAYRLTVPQGARLGLKTEVLDTRGWGKRTYDPYRSSLIENTDGTSDIRSMNVILPKGMKDAEIRIGVALLEGGEKKNRDYVFATFEDVALRAGVATDGQVEGEEGWGETVEGVQCRIRGNGTWHEGETPRLYLDVRNTSNESHCFHPAQIRVMCLPRNVESKETLGPNETEWNWRTIENMSLWKQQLLSRHEFVKGISIVLDKHWVHHQVPAYTVGGMPPLIPLQLGQGVYTMRCCLRVDPLGANEEPLQHGDFYVFSKPFGLKILPVEKAAGEVEGQEGWGEAVEGLRCRWRQASEPTRVGSDVVLAVEVENCSSEIVFWECSSEITLGVAESVSSGAMMPRFHVERGEGTRLCTADEALKAFSAGMPGVKGEDPV